MTCSAVGRTNRFKRGLVIHFSCEYVYILFLLVISFLLIAFIILAAARMKCMEHHSPRVDCLLLSVNTCFD